MKKNFILKLVTVGVLIIILSNFIITNFVYGTDIKPEDYMDDLQDDNFKDVGKDDAEAAIGGMDNGDFQRKNK